MKILFCGSSGFIGRHIAHEIGSRYDIVDFNGGSGADMTSREDVERAARGAGLIMHFGATGVGRRNVEEDTENFPEVLGTKNFAEAAASLGIPLVYASSIRVYGTDEEMAGGEAFNVSPRYPYGQMKLRCERIIEDMAGKRGLNFAIVRIAATYGVSMSSDFVVASFISIIKAGKPVVLSSKGEKKRNFVYARDVAHALAVLVETIPSVSREIINIAHGESYTLPELARLIGSLVAKQVEIVPGQMPDGASEEHIPIEKAKKLLGWSPTTSLRDGLREVLQKTNA